MLGLPGGGGSTPSFKSILTVIHYSNVSSSASIGNAKGKQPDSLALRAQWEMHLKGRCLPKATKKYPSSDPELSPREI